MSKMTMFDGVYRFAEVCSKINVSVFDISGEGQMSYRRVRRWVAYKFRRGQQQLKDAAHSGRPSSVTQA